jgi:glycosyltransferase involved in cell wall biosynthesis
MHVAWLFEYPTVNGGERSLLATAPRLRARGVRITAVAPPEGRLARQLAENNVSCAAFSAHQFEDKAAARAALERLLGQWKPDLVHANSLAVGRLCGPVLEALGLAGVAHLRDIVRLGGEALHDLASYRRLLAVSHATRLWHVMQGLPSARIHVLYNGVDVQRFAPAAPRGWLHNELGLPVHVSLIGYVGQLAIRKGADVLLAAMRQLAGRLPDLHLVLCGERYSTKPEAAQYEDLLRNLASDPLLAGRCHFLGYREDIDALLPELSVLAHPARQEPLGRVLLEAAACGCPIVATRVGGTAEIFPPEAHAALLVPPDDPSALAAALARVILEPSLAGELRRNARSRACQAFDLQTTAIGLVQHYQAALEGT